MNLETDHWPPNYPTDGDRGSGDGVSVGGGIGVGDGE